MTLKACHQRIIFIIIRLHAIVDRSHPWLNLGPKPGCAAGGRSWSSSVPRDKSQKITINYTTPSSFYIPVNPLFINCSTIQRHIKVPEAFLAVWKNKKLIFYPTLPDFWKSCFSEGSKSSLFCPACRAARDWKWIIWSILYYLYIITYNLFYFYISCYYYLLLLIIYYYILL
jgi:hypothetical protein